MNGPRDEEMRLLTQLDDLKVRLAELARENAELRVERDIERARVRALLPRATDEEEEEFRKQIEDGVWHDFSEVVAEITAELRGHNG